MFAIDEHRVLRRYRRPVPMEEACIMQYVRELGFPVPRVISISGTDMELERIHGPTMVEEILRRPLSINAMAKALADLHRRLERLPAPGWLKGDGDVIVHGDFHPLNVMVSRHGYEVIDWANARRGAKYFDSALTWLILRTATLEGPLLKKAVMGAIRDMFCWAFLRARGRRRTLALMPEAAGFRLADPNVTEAERRKVRALVARYSRRS